MNKPVWAIKAKELLKDKGMTQNSLMSVFDVDTQGAVSHYFTGKRQLNTDQLINLSQALNTDPNSLLDYKAHVNSELIKDTLSTVIENWLVRFGQMGWADYTNDPSVMRDLITDDIMKQLFDREVKGNNSKESKSASSD